MLHQVEISAFSAPTCCYVQRRLMVITHQIDELRNSPFLHAFPLSQPGKQGVLYDMLSH